MEKIRWGMIGTGAVTEKKSGPGFYKAHNSELKGVMNIDMDQAKDYARRHKVDLAFDSAKELINNSEIDAVYVATPPAFHKEYALMAIRAGKPVYIEKPMATSYEECLEIKELALKNKVKVFTAFYRRGMEKFQGIKKLIDNGEIGTVRYVNVVLHQRPEEGDYNKENLPWRLRGEISGGGKFLDMGIHTLDILDYIISPIEEVVSLVGNQGNLYEVEDIVTVTWKFQNGAHGIGAWSFTCGENTDRIEIVGNRGKISFSCFDDKPVVVAKDGMEKTFAFKSPEHVQQPFIQCIVDELLGKGEHPGSLESAIRSQLIADKILEEYKKTKNY